MNATSHPGEESARVSKAPREDARPTGLLERKETLTAYLLHRAQDRRQKFLRRAETFPIEFEMLRALYLCGCILFDFLAISQAIFLFPGVVGWVLAVTGFVLGAFLEGRFYMRHFALPKPSDSEL